MNTLGIINYKRINTILSTRIPHSLRFMIQLELLFRQQMECRIKTNHTTTTCSFWSTSCYIDSIHLIYNTLYPIRCSAEEIGCCHNDASSLNEARVTSTFNNIYRRYR